MIVPVGLIRAKRLVATFREAGALSRKTSASLRDLGVPDDVFFRSVAGEGVFVNTHGDSWYLDEDRAALYFGRRRRRVLVFVVVAVAVTLLIAVVKGS